MEFDGPEVLGEVQAIVQMLSMCSHSGICLILSMLFSFQLQCAVCKLLPDPMWHCKVHIEFWLSCSGCAYSEYLFWFDGKKEVKVYRLYLDFICTHFTLVLLCYGAGWSPNTSCPEAWFVSLLTDVQYILRRIVFDSAEADASLSSGSVELFQQPLKVPTCRHGMCSTKL